MVEFHGLESVDGVLTRVPTKKAMKLLVMIESDLDANERPILLAETFSFQPRYHWLMLTDARVILMNKGTVIQRQIQVESTLFESSGGENGVLRLTENDGETIEIPMRGGDHHAIVDCVEHEGLTATVGDQAGDLDTGSLEPDEAPDWPDAVDMESQPPVAGDVEFQASYGSLGMAQELADLDGLLERGVLSPEEHRSAAARLAASSSGGDESQLSKQDVPEDGDDVTSRDSRVGATGGQDSQGEAPLPAPSLAGNERVLLDEQGYIVTPTRLFVPPDKVFSLSQVVSCDLRQSTSRVPVQESRDSNAAGFAVLAAVIFGIGLALSEVADGWIFSVSLVLSIWLLTQTRKKTVYDERTTSWLKVAYSNRSDREVLVTKDNRFARRLHAAIVEAIGPE